MENFRFVFEILSMCVKKLLQENMFSIVEIQKKKREKEDKMKKMIIYQDIFYLKEKFKNKEILNFRFLSAYHCTTKCAWFQYMYIGLEQELSHVQVSVQLQGKKVNMKSLLHLLLLKGFI